MNAIRVHVVRYKDRDDWLMYYRDPMTRQRKSRTTGVAYTGKKSKRDAQQVAGDWEKELRECQSDISWKAFRNRYEDERLTGLAEKTDRKVATVFNSVERIVNPTRLRDLTAERISFYQAELRRQGRSEDTIASNLAHLRAALQWAVSLGLLPSLPKIERPKRVKSAQGMKGRPITREEFERMLAKTPQVVGKTAAESWNHLLEGLWCSGLRLGEALELYWDRDDKLSPRLAGEDSCLVIPGELEKGHKDRLLAMAPEFVEFLSKTPEADRHGPIFKPQQKKTEGGGRKVARVGVDRAGHVISEIGRAAGVVVRADAKTGKVKHASAHDLRRSFGERWAGRIMPADLKELMRHESIDTTLRYYVGNNARRTAKTLWTAHKQAKNVNKNVNTASAPSPVPVDANASS